MQMGIRCALPLGSSCSKPRARGPLLALGARANWAVRGETAHMAATRMTAHPYLRYKRDGELAMQVNDKAPEFTLPDENEKDVSLKDFRGKHVVLFFFPKADTPG